VLGVSIASRFGLASEITPKSCSQGPCVVGGGGSLSPTGVVHATGSTCPIWSRSATFTIRTGTLSRASTNVLAMYSPFGGAFMLGSTRVLSAFMVASGRVNTTLSHRAGITSSLRRVSREDRGRALGFHRDTSSSPIRSTRRPTSTDALQSRSVIHDVCSHSVRVIDLHSVIIVIIIGSTFFARTLAASHRRFRNLFLDTW
jgi:hypothetical protein